MGYYGAFKDVGLFLNGIDLKDQSNMVKLTAIKEVFERAVFGNIAKVRVAAGLKDLTLAAAGFMSTELEQNLRANLYTNANLMTFILPQPDAAPAIGDYAFFFSGLMPKYEIGDAQGKDLLYGLNVQGGGDDAYGLCIGNCLNPGSTLITEDGSSTGFHAGAVATGKYLYGILHVTSVSAGDSIVMKIQSSATVGFEDPHNRITFDSKAVVGAQLAVRIAGEITDEYWRANYDVSGESVSILAAVAMAIM